jgi:hypothetical protein
VSSISQNQRLIILGGIKHSETIEERSSKIQQE